MFDKPTIEDFVAQLSYHCAEATRGLGKWRAEMQAKAVAQGAGSGSRLIVVVMEETGKAADRGASIILGELRRAIRDTNLNPRLLRDTTAAVLDEMVTELVAASNVEKIGSWLGKDEREKIITEIVEGLRHHMCFRLRQFDIGFDSPVTPEPSQVTHNTVNAGIIGALQQGTSHSQQSVSVMINVGEATRAVADLERELERIDVAPDTLDELRGDLETIKGQLRKPRPSLGIIREAATSLRNIAEGVLGGVLTPGALQALAALSAAVGL